MTAAAPVAEVGTAAAPPTAADTAGSAGSLVRAARAGHRPAWDELVGRFGPLLWGIARRHGLSPEDSADAVRITWLRCVERVDRDPDRVAAWLVTTCRRESLAAVRRAGGTGTRTAGPDPRVRRLDGAVLDQEERILRADAAW
jgi:DNA-directed RNA polymerase specialized sigma24 family protein